MTPTVRVGTRHSSRRQGSGSQGQDRTQEASHRTAAPGWRLADTTRPGGWSCGRTPAPACHVQLTRSWSGGHCSAEQKLETI